MNKSELQKIIREEVRKIIKEANTPTEAQDFAIAAFDKYKSALLGVDFIKSSGRTVVTAHVDIDKWRLADKYWANKYTATLSNKAFVFKSVPKDASNFKSTDMFGTEVPK